METALSASFTTELCVRCGFHLPACLVWAGCLRQSPLLGAGAGACHAADGPAVCRALSEDDWHDENDAEAICEVVGQPLLRFVPVKDVGSRRCRKRGLAWPFPALILLRQPTPKVCPASLSLDRTAPRWWDRRPRSRTGSAGRCRPPLRRGYLRPSSGLGFSDCHSQEGCDSLQLPSRRGLAARWNETYRSIVSMLPCPRISPEVRPKSPHCSRLRPAPSSVPRVQDNVIILIRRNPRWVRRFMSVDCPTRRPSRS